MTFRMANDENNHTGTELNLRYCILVNCKRCFQQTSKIISSVWNEELVEIWHERISKFYLHEGKKGSKSNYLLPFGRKKPQVFTIVFVINKHITNQ